MFDNMISIMYLNQRDEEDWNDNPIEFIRKEEDVVDSSSNLKVIGRDLWERLVED
jgi:hypothetical protein